MRTKAEARHYLFMVAGELLADPWELIETIPDLVTRILRGDTYEDLLAYANENC